MRPLCRVSDSTASGTRSPTRLGVPVPPLDEDLAKYPWMVRHDPVHAEVQQADHLAWIVDSPHVDLKAPTVGHPEQTAIHDGYAGLANWHLEAQGGRSAGRNAQTGQPEPSDGKRASRRAHGRPEERSATGQAPIGEGPKADPVKRSVVADQIDQGFHDSVVLGVDVDSGLRELLEKL